MFHHSSKYELIRRKEELNRIFSVFHKDVNQAIAKVTGKKEKIPDILPEVNTTHNEALFDRLAAGTEVKKLEIIGTGEKPESMSVGHTESHLKVLKVDPNFLDEVERKKLEELYNKEFVTKTGWRQSFMNALNRGQLKSVVVQSIRTAKYVRKRRNALIGRGINAKGLWHMAIYKVIYGIRAAKANLIIDTVSDKSLVSQLREFQTRADSVTLAKIEAALELPSALRSDEELRFLNRAIMSQVKHFSKYTLDQRIQFCNVMTFEKHGPGKTILKQGHPPWNFYFLFSGQCDVVKNRTDGQEGHVRVHVINAGESFGAVALEGLVQEVRTATVITTTESVFLVIDKDQYRKIASGEDSLDQLTLRLSLLKSMQLFEDCESNILEQIALKTRLGFHEEGSVILKEGEISSKIYFIAKGSVAVSRKINIIKITGTSKYIPYDPSTPLQKNQNLSTFQVTYSTCDSSEHFPEPDDPSLYDLEDVNIKQKLQNRLSSLETKSLNTSFSTYQCKTPVVCMSIHSLDFAKLAPTAMLQNLLKASAKFRVSDQDLTSHFILKHEWDIHKKKMITGYVKPHISKS